MTTSASSTSRRRPRPRSRADVCARLFLLALVLGASACTTAGTLDATEDVAPVNGEVDDLVAAGRADEARALLRARRIADPSDLDAFLREIELTRDPAAEAGLAAELDGMLAAAGSPRRRADLLALRAYLSTPLPHAETRLRAALEAAPSSALAAAVLAHRLEARGDDELAAPFWRQAGESARVPDFVLLPLARAETRAGRIEAAIDALDRLTSRRPRDASAHYDLGTLLLERGREPKRALVALERALELTPDDLDVALNAATAALMNGRDERAQEILEDAERRHPDDPLPHFQLGILYADHRDEPERAVRHFERYLELGGEHDLRVARWLDELRLEAAGS